MTWADSSKPSVNTSSEKEEGFQLGMDLSYRDGTGKNATAVYEGASANGQMHTIRLEDGARLDTHDSNLQLLEQPDFLISRKHSHLY